MTQPEFFMTCQICMKGLQVQQGEKDGESVAILQDGVYLKYEKHPKCMDSAVILHIREKSYLVETTTELRQIARIYCECKEKKTDLSIRLTSYAGDHLKTC